MRAIALSLPLFACAAAASCTGQDRLSPPGPPTPAPPAAAREPAPAQRVSPEAEVQHLVPPPAYAVAMVEVAGGKRIPAVERAVQAANLLVHNGLHARVPKLPDPIPPTRREAALRLAETLSRDLGNVLLFGEVTPGRKVEVRMLAVDIERREVIAELGFESDSADAEAIIRKTVEAILGRVEAYWRDSARRR